MPLAALLLLTAKGAGAQRITEDWTGTWASSQLQPYGTEVLPRGILNGATLREVVHLSAGGARLRLHLSNAFGEQALRLDAVHVALKDPATPGAILPGSDRALLFGGKPAATIPMGAEYLSDPLDLSVAPLSDLVVTMTIAAAPETLTLHAGARATSFLLPGAHVADPVFASPQTFTRWYFLAGVEVSGGPARSALVTLGDSITDGHGATTDGNDRWPDVLARRLASRGIGVLNEGIGGNRVLADGLGPNALARFDRDVVSQPGARFLLIFEGINDLGGLDRTEEHPQAAHDALVAQLEAAFQQMAARAHAHGMQVFGATVSPDGGSGYYHPGARSEADRQALNQWIRTSGTFDGVVDFDRVLRDPQHPDSLLPAADSGDHLHPGPAGYAMMGDAISLDLFREPGKRVK